jgi:cyanophycinase-like exopeptidase
MENNPGTITLIGSGELGETMAKTHRALLGQVAAPVEAVFLDTPAGFEVNADEISAKAVEYFKQRFDVALIVASFKSKNRATAHQVAAALGILRRANFIFAGPGSPSYAVNNWRGSLLWDALIARWMTGTQLVFASAGAIALGSVSLPVYEIYKAGHHVDWIDGLDLLGAFGLKLAILPHWNNAEGETYDTRFCFMGAERFGILASRLPWDVVILGIDEHTAFTLDPQARQGSVRGAGSVTVHYAGRAAKYPAGATISFDQMRALNLGTDTAPNATPTSPTAAPPPPAPQFVATTLYLDQLARAIRETPEPAAQRELIDHAHDTMHELAQDWRPADTLTPEQGTAALIELLVRTRAQLRAAKQFALADQVRQSLGNLGIVLEDTPAGTTWKRMEQK